MTEQTISSRQTLDAQASLEKQKVNNLFKQDVRNIQYIHIPRLGYEPRHYIASTT